MQDAKLLEHWDDGGPDLECAEDTREEDARRAAYRLLQLRRAERKERRNSALSSACMTLGASAVLTPLAILGALCLSSPQSRWDNAARSDTAAASVDSDTFQGLPLWAGACAEPNADRFKGKDDVQGEQLKVPDKCESELDGACELTAGLSCSVTPASQIPAST